MVDRRQSSDKPQGAAAANEQTKPIASGYLGNDPCRQLAALTGPRPGSGTDDGGAEEAGKDSRNRERRLRRLN